MNTGIKRMLWWGGLMLVVLPAAFLGIRGLHGGSIHDAPPLDRPALQGAATVGAAPAVAAADAVPTRPVSEPPVVRLPPQSGDSRPDDDREPAVVLPPPDVPAVSGGAGDRSPASIRPFEPGQGWVMDLRIRAARDPAAALDYCLALPEDQRLMACHLVFTDWAHRNPQVAFAAAQRLQEPLRSAMVMNTLNLWAARDPDGALVQLESEVGLPAEVRAQIRLRAISAMGGRDPVAALTLLAGTDLVDKVTRNRITGELLGSWVVRDGASALAWLKDSDVDEATYDLAVVTAVERMAYGRSEDAAALFEEFVTTGRMDGITDDALYAKAVLVAKTLGVSRGSKDYAGALEWGFGLPPDSAAQAYVLSNVAFSQVHGRTLPDMPWIAEMNPGFARTRVIAAVAYGRLLANGDRALGDEVKQQLDADEFKPARIRDILRESSIAVDEKRTLLGLL